MGPMDKAIDRYFRALWKQEKASSPLWQKRWSAAARAASLEYLTLEATQQASSAGKPH